MRKLLPRTLIVVVAVGVAAAFGQPVHAQTTDVDEARKDLDAARAELDEANREYNAALDELTRVTDELQVAQDELDAAAAEVERARELLREQAVSAYQSAGGLGTITALLDEDSEQALQRIEVATVMAERQQRQIREATAVTAAYEQAVARLESARARHEELTGKAEVAFKALEGKFADAEDVYQRAQAEARRLEQERLEEERRAAARATAAAQARQQEAQAPADGQGSQSVAPDAVPVAARVADGVACPLEGPYSYIDSWGAPRSGGRSHKGTDIMAAHGKTVFAYTDGVVSRTTPNRGLGGFAVYLQGDDGNEYYYAHLDSYSVSEGQRVTAGEPLGRNGSTGNASASAPHVHFEVHPGGGTAVNPYSFVERACG